jgi:hypothetical protein
MTMPTFEIPDGPTTVELKRTGDAKNPGPATGSIVFNVTNKSSDACDGRLGVVVSGGSKDAWFSIDGDRERTFDAGETQTATIKVSAPADTAAGNYPFRLRAVAVNDPDNDHAEGPVATAQVPPATGAPPPTKWWLWILIGVVVLLLVVVALWFAFSKSGGDDTVKVQENKTAGPLPPPPLPTPTSHMSLEPGFDRPGLDIQGGQTVANARACAQLCVANEKCVAMTYVFPSPGVPQNGACWIKYGIPAQAPNPYMISGVKVSD